LRTLLDECEAMGLPLSAVPDVVKAFTEPELAELAAHEARMRRLGGAPGSERIPLRDEHGEEFGRIEARIPAALFYNIGLREGYGFQAWEDEGFLKDVLRDHPQLRVKTVQPNGRVVTGYRGPRRAVVKRY
jgi:hypothetical protein